MSSLLANLFTFLFLFLGLNHYNLTTYIYRAWASPWCHSRKIEKFSFDPCKILLIIHDFFILYWGQRAVVPLKWSLSSYWDIMVYWVLNSRKDFTVLYLNFKALRKCLLDSRIWHSSLYSRWPARWWPGVQCRCIKAYTLRGERAHCRCICKLYFHPEPPLFFCFSLCVMFVCMPCLYFFFELLKLSVNGICKCCYACNHEMILK